MRWEKQGDILVLLDSHHWKRAIVYLDQNCSGYIGVATFGAAHYGTPSIVENRYTNKAVAKRETARQVRQDGYK